MPADALVERLERLAPIGLPELDATAALLVRRDRKYIVPVDVATRLLASLEGSCRVLDIDGARRFRYESVYFDTSGHASYLSSARRRRRRFKVRTRTYLDSGRCLLELKTRDQRGRTVKQRQDHPIEIRGRLGPADRAFAGRCPLIGAASAALEPALTTRYTRATLLAGAARSRVTIDTDVEGRTPDGRRVTLVDMVIVETKSPGPPSGADRILWSLGYRPTRVSKFCTSLAALSPELPSNRWTQALRQPWLVAGADGMLADRADDSPLELAG